MPKKQKGSGGVFSSSAKVTPAEIALKQAQEQIQKNKKTIKSAKKESKRAVSQASVRPSSNRTAYEKYTQAAEEELKKLEKSLRGGGGRGSKPVIPINRPEQEATQSLVDNYSLYKVIDYKTNREAKIRALSSAAQSARTLVTLTKQSKSKLNPRSEKIIKEVIAESRKMSALPPITSG